MSRRGIQLCYPFTTERLAKWAPPFILQPKLDGERCRALIDYSGVCTLLSSEENIISSVPHINEALQNLHLHSVELDGELYIHGADFSSIHSIVSRKENMHPDAQYMELHLFDIVNDLPQVKRTSQLFDTIPFRLTGITFGPLQIVPCRFVSTLAEIMKALEEFMKAGYEGFVVRDALASYVRKRSTQMMKFKPRKEDIYEIVGYKEEYTFGTKVPKGRLGALSCNGGNGETFDVGSGSLLTRDTREELWKVRDSLIGKWARIKYQHLTHARGVPRFPVIVEIIDNFGN